MKRLILILICAAALFSCNDPKQSFYVTPLNIIWQDGAGQDAYFSPYFAIYNYSKGNLTAVEVTGPKGLMYGQMIAPNIYQTNNDYDARELINGTYRISAKNDQDEYNTLSYTIAIAEDDIMGEMAVNEFYIENDKITVKMVPVENAKAYAIAFIPYVNGYIFTPSIQFVSEQAANSETEVTLTYTISTSSLRYDQWCIFPIAVSTTLNYNTILQSSSRKYYTKGDSQLSDAPF